MRKGDALSNSQGRLHSMGCPVNNQENMSRSDEWAPTLVLTQGEALSCQASLAEQAMVTVAAPATARVACRVIALIHSE